MNSKFNDNVTPTKLDVPIQMQDMKAAKEYALS